MSGPFSPNEIEDVVSSVRRLVSADPRPKTLPRDSVEDRLVLTSALRIVAEGTGDPVPFKLATRVKEEDPAPSIPTHVFDASPGQEAVDQAQPPEPQWEDALWAEPEPPLAELALGAEEAEVVAEVAPTQLARDMAALDQGVTDSAMMEGPPETESPWAEVGEDWLDDAPPSAPAERPMDVAETPSARPDMLKLSAQDRLTDGEGNPLTVLDEAALQKIIRQLIRDELKGVLGERITHSVRKLVRAEINRALAAHALD